MEQSLKYRVNLFKFYNLSVYLTLHLLWHCFKSKPTYFEKVSFPSATVGSENYIISLLRNPESLACYTILQYFKQNFFYFVESLSPRIYLSDQLH